MVTSVRFATTGTFSIRGSLALYGAVPVVPARTIDVGESAGDAPGAPEFATESDILIVANGDI